MDLLKHLKNYSSAIKRRGYLESLNVKYLFLLFLFKYLLFDNSYIKHIIQCAFQCSFHFSRKKKKNALRNYMPLVWVKSHFVLFFFSLNHQTKRSGIFPVVAKVSVSRYLLPEGHLQGF